MGFLSRVLGRSTPPAATLEPCSPVGRGPDPRKSAMGLRPTGGSVCFRAAEGGATHGHRHRRRRGSAGRRWRARRRALGRRVRLHLAAPAPRAGRHRRSGHRAARRQRHAAGQRVRPGLLCSPGRAGRRRRPSGEARLHSTSAAPSTRSLRRRQGAGHPLPKRGCAARSVPTCRSSGPLALVPGLGRPQPPDRPTPGSEDHSRRFTR